MLKCFPVSVLDKFVLFQKSKSGTQFWLGIILTANISMLLDLIQCSSLILALKQLPINLLLVSKAEVQ